MRRPLLAAALLLCAFAATLDATEFEFSGQVRARFESMDSTFVPHIETGWSLPLRVRLGVNAVVSERLRGYVQIQDARLFGEEKSTVSNDKNIDLHAAYGELRQPWSSGEWQVRVGRQEVAYGNERIIGTLDWNNVGRSFDALHSRMRRGAWTTDLMAARIAATGTGAGSDSDDLFLSYNRYAVPERDVAGEFYAIYRDDSRGIFETTLGEHAAGNIGRLRFDEEFAYMLGQRQGRDLGAFLASAQVHLRLAERGKPTLGAGVDFLSGDGDPSDDEDRYFDTNRLFHTGHKFYGLMDVAERLAGSAGLVDPYGVLSCSGPRQLLASATVHVFYVDQRQTFSPSADSSYLGTEVDAVLGFTPVENARFELGGAVFLPGAAMKARSQSANGSWAYLQTTVGF